AQIARQNAADLYLRDAVITGLGGRELEFLERLLDDKSPGPSKAGCETLLGVLAQCVFTEAKADRVNRLLNLAAERPAGNEWQRLALLDGILSTAPPGAQGKVRIKPVRLNAEPAALAALSQCEAKEGQDRAKRIA